MAANEELTHQRGIHPVHAVLLAGTIPLFLGAVLSDIGYALSYQIQWTNFASWLIAGGLLFGAPALLWAVIDHFSDRRGGHSRGGHPHGGHPVSYLILLLTTWILGFINALIHAKDAWASMPTGLVLSVIVFILACMATWAGLSGLREGGAR